MQDAGPWGVKLHAVGTPLKVTPGSPHKEASADPPTEEYTLEPKTNDQTEIILLRANDSVSSSRASGRLALAWKVPQVQVNSSVTAEGEIPDSEDQHVQGSASNLEEETEDEESLDRPVANAVHLSSGSTPLLSASREVVQETPNVGRVKDMVASPAKLSASPVEETQQEEISPKMPSEEAEVFSTAPAKRHPTVKIPSKRTSADADDAAKSDPPRSIKRAKTDSEIKSNQNSVIEYPIRKTATKTKRLSDVEKEVSASPKSQRSSQRSLRDDGDSYDGPTPRVVFSNSAIPESGKAAMKFLKANGVHVDSINDDCNILW